MNLFLGILIFFTFNTVALSSSEEPVCSLIWGQAQVNGRSNFCKVDITDSSQPHLIQLKVFEKDLAPQQMIRLKMSVDSIKNLEGAEFRFFNEGSKTDYIYYRIPSYADENFNWLLPEQPNDVTFSVSQLEGKKNKKTKYNSLGLFVKIKPGSKNSVTIQDVQITSKPSFGKGIISLTFDDGFSSLVLADQILRKHKLNGTAYIIREAIGQKGYITADQVCLLSQGVWSIGSHSTTPFVEVNDLKKWIQDDIAWMKNQCGGRFSWEHLAYPLGKINFKVLEMISPIYKTARIAGSGVETLPPANPWKLRTINVTPSLSPREIQKLAKKAVENGDWLILMFHHIVKEKPKNDLEYSADRFDQIAKGLRTYQKQVTKIPDVKF